MKELTNEEKHFIERVRPLLMDFLEMCEEEGIEPGAGSYVLSERGKIYHGVPFEHIRCIHGEENAIGTMLTEEGQNSKFEMILIVGSPKETIMPCGICREAIRRYGVDDASILCTNQSFAGIEKFTVSDLYPRPYVDV